MACTAALRSCRKTGGGFVRTPLPLERRCGACAAAFSSACRLRKRRLPLRVPLRLLAAAAAHCWPGICMCGPRPSTGTRALPHLRLCWAASHQIFSRAAAAAAQDAALLPGAGPGIPPSTCCLHCREHCTLVPHPAAMGRTTAWRQPCAHIAHSSERAAPLLHPKQHPAPTQCCARRRTAVFSRMPPHHPPRTRMLHRPRDRRVFTSLAQSPVLLTALAAPIYVSGPAPTHAHSREKQAGDHQP